MIRGFWIALPLLLVIALDGAFTLLGEPPAYWQGHYDVTNEANPIGIYFLGVGPKAFALAMAAWAGIAVLLSRLLPGLLGQAFYGFVGLMHVSGALSWSCNHMPQLLSTMGNAIGGNAARTLGAMARSPHVEDCGTFGTLAFLSLATVFCWRRAGLLPAASAKPKPGKDADKKDKR